VLAAVGLGVAAVNTGNNLAYLLCAILLALITVSGMLSDLSLRGLRVTAVLPEEVYAGREAVVGAVVANPRRWLPACSVVLEALVPAGGPAGRGRPGAGPASYLPYLPPRGDRVCTWTAVLPRRGRQRLPGVRLATRFPFGLFVKATGRLLEAEVLVYPALGRLPPEGLALLAAAGETPAGRRGRGHDLHGLREYHPGDDLRLVHWPTTARTGVLTVRELEEETAQDTRIVLLGPGGDPDRLEAGLSEAATLAVALLRAGAGVEVAGPGLAVPLGRGRGHARVVLAALALYAPPPPGTARAPAAAPGLREVGVRL
jgi:uncharacterized protein (DUF58 family)